MLIAPSDADHEGFARLFGKTSLITPVRPDGYIAFTGHENSVPGLEKILRSVACRAGSRTGKKARLNRAPVWSGTHRESTLNHRVPRLFVLNSL
jgi:hypothetical protein